MTSRVLIFFAMFLCKNVASQVPKAFFMGKIWSKEISLYKAKAFVLNNVLDSTSDIVKFEVTPLTASNSGELTTHI